MASNKLPTNLDELAMLAEDAADGAHQLETTLGLKQNTEVAIRTDLADLTAQRSAYDTVASDSAAKGTAVTVARSNARAFLTSARDVFKNFFGAKPSAAWVAAGWPANSIAVPATSELLLPLLQSVELSLAANPARENAPLNLTAARAAALHTALADARSAANQQGQAERAAREARDVSADKLRKRLRGLIDELGQLLDSLDARWLAFGLKRPGAPESPDAMIGTRATPLGGGKLRVQCDPAPRAEYYQIWIQVLPADADFRLAESPAEPDKILEGLPAGAQIKVKLRAINETGPGPFGEAIQTTLA